MCCPFKMMVKCCRCCCKTLPEWCHACADETREDDREIIMRYERRMRRLEENRRPDARVIPTNRVKVCEEVVCEEVEPNQTRVRQKKKSQPHKSAGGPRCFCGCGSEGAEFHRAALNELLACTEGDPVYFNVPGLKVQQAQKLIMKPNVSFSLAGVLTKVADDQYLFKIPRGLKTQHRAWQHGRFEELHCSRRKELHSTYFLAMLPCHVVMWFLSKTPQYTCINTPKD